MTTTDLASPSAVSPEQTVGGSSDTPTPEPPTLDLVVPVYNEANALRPSIERLHADLTEQFPLSTRITIADNGSTDGTWELAHTLRDELPGVEAVRLEQKGRGLALHDVWSASDAPDLRGVLRLARDFRAVLTAANVLATILRFVLLRSWVFRARRVAPEVTP